MLTPLPVMTAIEAYTPTCEITNCLVLHVLLIEDDRTNEISSFIVM